MEKTTQLVDCPNCKREGFRIILLNNEKGMICPLCDFTDY